MQGKSPDATSAHGHCKGSLIMSLEKAKAKIIENNEKISTLLRENEDLLRAEGFDLPNDNLNMDGLQKIKIPSQYIRTKEYFYEKYHLYIIVSAWDVRNNIAYSFQVSDLYNYLINRFNIWGSVETMLYKNAIINFVSIFEAFVFECANNICMCPSQCGKTNKCKRHFSNTQRNNSYKALCRMRELHIVDYDEAKMERIKEIIELRNRIHIRLAENNEFNSSDFCLAVYNEVIGLLKQISEDIYTNGVKLYACGKRITE